MRAGGVHKESLRHNVDQQIRSGVQNPQVIVEKDLMEMTKYLVKSVEIMAASTAARPKNRPVPMQSEAGKDFWKSWPLTVP